MSSKTAINLNAPPIEWFSKPADLVPGNGMTISDDGHVYGYLCLWNARFINGGRGQVTPPRGCDYDKWTNVFKTKTTAETINCGVIAGKGGHKFKDGFGSTQAAYADIDNKFARVKYGEDEHGVWFSGALMPGVSEEDVTYAMASGVSGHWEKPERNSTSLECIGSVLVNLPAFAQAAGQHRIAASVTLEATETGGMISQPMSEEVRPKPGDRLEFSLDAGQVLAAAGDVQAPISGRLLQTNTVTVDGRVIQEVEWTTLPLPLYWAEAQSYGHQGSTVVGAIQAINVSGDEVTFDGVLDAAFLKAQGAKDVGDLGVLGVSIDGAVTGDVEFEWDDDNDGFWPDRMIFTKMQILGATLTSMPAFHSTIGLTVGDFNDTGTGNTTEGDTTNNGLSAEPDFSWDSNDQPMTIKLPNGSASNKEM